MELKKRITDLMAALCKSLPERDFCIQLAFLTMFVGEPFYLYGRTGSGKALVIDRLIAALKNAKALKIGRRQQEIPSDLSSYDIIAFQGFDTTNENTKNQVQIALQDRQGTPLIISGDVRPEVALARGEILDKVALTVALPDSISADALCQLLTASSDVTGTDIPEELTISREEIKKWNEEIKKVVFSKDSLTLIGRLAEICDKNNIYVSIKKWLVLSNIAKAAAFFNDRTETNLMDTFFFGTDIWGKPVSNKVVVDGYKEIVVELLLKDIPEVFKERYDANILLERCYKIIYSSNNKYDTQEFNGEPCVSYKITVAGESTPIYVPLRYVETDMDFNPFNELHQVEKRVLCNYHATPTCTISVDSAVKNVGLRTNAIRSPNSTIKQGKFEVFAKLPTYILVENDPEVIEQKKIQREETVAEINEQMERETKILMKLRDIYRELKKNKSEMFCNTQLFREVLDQIKNKFDETATIIGKIQEAHKALAPKSGKQSA